MSIAIFLPTRKGSLRVAQKNTRPFAGISGGLLELKLSQLIKVEGVKEIIFSTNDESSIEIANKMADRSGKLRILTRPDELSSSETDLSDLIKYVPQLTEAEHILWTHVTSPFCSEDHYSEMIRTYSGLNGSGNDSLVGVSKLMNFIWDPAKGDIINRNGEQRWPRTQDLKLLFEINNSAFLAPRSTFLEGDRIGKSPYLYEMEKIPSMDIDDREDFLIATALYEALQK